MSRCTNPIEVRNPNYQQEKALNPNITRFRLVPCGKCMGCLMTVSDEWSTRLFLELDSWDSSHFVTLTYDDDHLPLDGVCKRHLQLFHKRLRKYGFKFKYLVISEYGSHTHRPHYHGIYFGLRDDCFQLWPHGFVEVKPVNENNIRYVSGYHILRNEFLPNGDVNKNFKLCSRGLGFDSFVKNELTNVKSNDWRFLHLNGGFHSIPRYYRKKFDIKYDVDNIVFEVDPRTFASREANTKNYKFKKFIKKQI